MTCAAACSRRQAVTLHWVRLDGVRSVRGGMVEVSTALFRALAPFVPGATGDPCEAMPVILTRIHAALMPPSTGTVTDPRCTPTCWSHDLFWYRTPVAASSRHPILVVEPCDRSNPLVLQSVTTLYLASLGVLN